MNQRKLSLSIAAIAIIGIGIVFFVASEATALPGCQHQGACFGSGCVPIPTSLPVANGGSVGGGDIGWVPNGGACGTKSCYLILRCACGSPLSTQWCQGEDFPPECV